MPSPFLMAGGESRSKTGVRSEELVLDVGERARLAILEGDRGSGILDGLAETVELALGRLVKLTGGLCTPSGDIEGDIEGGGGDLEGWGGESDDLLAVGDEGDGKETGWGDFGTLAGTSGRILRVFGTKLDCETDRGWGWGASEFLSGSEAARGDPSEGLPSPNSEALAFRFSASICEIEELTRACGFGLAACADGPFPILAFSSCFCATPSSPAMMVLARADHIGSKLQNAARARSRTPGLISLKTFCKALSSESRRP